MNEEVNLLGNSSKNTTLVPTKKLQTMRAFATILLFIISASSIVLFILVALSPLPELQRQEKTLREQLAASHAEMGKLALIDERVTNVSEILKHRRQFDKLLDLVQSTMAKDVRISSLRVDKNIIVLTVQSSSLKSLDNFLSGLIQAVQNKQGFSQVTLNDLTTEAATNNYTVTLNLVML